MDAYRTFRSCLRAWARPMGDLRAFALVAVVMLAFAACATHPKPPPPPARPARSVPAPRTRVRVPPTSVPNAGDSLAPADVGYYMDVMQGRLKQAVGTDIGIVRRGDRIVLDLTSRMAFGPGSTQLSAGDHAIIASLSRALVEYRMTLVSVRVRSVDPATHAIDAHLSEQRAQAIANNLAEAGVASKRIVIAGVGAEKHPQIELTLEPIVSPAGSGH